MSDILGTIRATRKTTEGCSTKSKNFVSHLNASYVQSWCFLPLLWSNEI